MHAPLREGVLIKASGAIDAGSESRTRAANVICWTVAADVMTQEEHDAGRRNYNQAFGIDVNDPEVAKVAGEPDPV
ncbi:hypothetical protein Amn_pc00640 (plasmid) [Aminobacter sp. Y103A]|uniref:hypothetical protein n=1 Tax=Phyllobacteriaceae TaxID=69277 RepID=UPI0018EDA413|nr:MULTISPECIES: hypothetical protein [Phyllobacteriaceae]BBD41349.1 hypothetical protein Amn_pc00640 [Aminobacter sp. SS-2016]BCH20070.1 hypothetical protein MesoLjLa_69210 [Mesorhizobium sp. L-2-11]